MVVGKLKVLVCDANLQLKERRTGFLNLSKHRHEPCVRIRCGHTVSFKTKAWKNGSNTPEWNEEFMFFVTERQQPILEVDILDTNHYDENLGRCKIRFDRMVMYARQGETVDRWYHLKRDTGKNKPEQAGQVHLKVTIEFDPAYLAREAMMVEAEKSGGQPADPGAQRFPYNPSEEQSPFPDQRAGPGPSGSSASLGVPGQDRQPSNEDFSEGRTEYVPDAAPSEVGEDMSRLSINPDQARDEPPPPGPAVNYTWEYKWQLESTEVFGPYSTADMLSWKDQGYFTGDMVAWVRLIPENGAPQTGENEGFVMSDTVNFELYQ
eukprot:tig00000411_g535.t1